MEALRTKAEYNGIFFNPAAQVIYDTGNSGAPKKRHGISCVGSKGGVNKVRRYTSTYATSAD